MPAGTEGYINFCGENVVDMIQTRQGRDGTTYFAANLGGSAFNAAIGAARLIRAQKLPIEIRYIGVVSRDQFGEQFMCAMRNAGVNTNLCPRTDAFTTKAFVTSTVEGGERKNGFSFNRDLTDRAAERIPGAVRSLAAVRDDVPNIFAFGCISSVMDPEYAHYLAAAAEANNQRLGIFYDLNTRPQLIGNLDQYRARVDGWRKMAGIVKMSTDDLAITSPGKTLADIAENDSQRIYIATDGGKGAQAIFNRTDGPVALRASAKPLIVPNSVGAGDNFNAGFLVGLAKRGLWTPEQWYNIPKSVLAKCVQAGNLAAEQHLMRQDATVIPGGRKGKDER